MSDGSLASIIIISISAAAVLISTVTFVCFIKYVVHLKYFLPSLRESQKCGGATMRSCVISLGFRLKALWVDTLAKCPKPKLLMSPSGQMAKDLRPQVSAHLISSFACCAGKHVPRFIFLPFVFFEWNVL